MKKIVILMIFLFFVAGCTTDSSSDIKKGDFLVDSNGHLIFRGEDLGSIKGADGKDGIDGNDGVDGKNGLPGRNGIDGINGKDGLNGTNGIDGRYSLEGVIHRFIDLSEYNVGDQLPYDAGVIPFDWKVDENTIIRVNSISFTLKAKYTLEESKTDISKREYDTFYPYIIEFKATGTAPMEYANKKIAVVILENGHAGYGAGGVVKSDGSFEAKYDYGLSDYYLPVFRRANFEDCAGNCADYLNP